MNTAALSEIQVRLGLSLPESYKQALLNPPSLHARHSTDFQCDPTEIIVANLELRMAPVENAFAGASWPETYVCIGDDGCGNFFVIDSADSQGRVLVFDHESNDFQPHSDSLPQFFDSLNHGAARFPSGSMPKAPQKNSPQLGPEEVAISRTSILRHSILDPIALNDWVAFVESDPDLQVRGYRSAVNPVTNEEIRVQCPGLTIVPGQFDASQIMYVWGRIYCRRASAFVATRMCHAAIVLNAQVHRGSSHSGLVAGD